MMRSEQEVLNNKQFNESNETYLGPQQVVVEATVVTKDKASDATTNKNKCCCCGGRYKSWKSVKSTFSVLSIYGFASLMSIMTCGSFCSVLSINAVFSVASSSSLASVASANSAFSIGSINCYGCIFNVPITRRMNRCDKSSLTTDDRKELLSGVTYETFSPSTKDLSEEDLANDCCLHIHSSEATKQGLQGFIINSNRTACLMFGESGDEVSGIGNAVLDKVDVDAAQNIYKPTS